MLRKLIDDPKYRLYYLIVGYPLMILAIRFLQVFNEAFFTYLYDPFFIIFLVWSGISYIFNLKKLKNIRSWVNIVMIVIFGFGVVSMHLNPETITVHNITYLLLSVVLAMECYNFSLRYTEVEYKQFFNRVVTILSVIVNIINIATVILIVLSVYSIDIPGIKYFYPYFLINLETRKHGPGFHFGGLYLNKSMLGFFSYVGIFLTIYRVKLSKLSIPKSVIYILFSLVTLYFSDNRVSMIAVFVIFFSLVYVQLRKKIGKKKTIITCVISIIILAFIYINFATFKDVSIKEMLANFTTDPAATFHSLSSARDVMWNSILSMRNELFLFGKGWHSDLTGYWAENAHNLFFNFFFWSGLPSLILAIILNVYFVIRLIKNWKNVIATSDRWLLVLLICVYIQSMLDLAIVDSGQPETVLFWLILGYFIHGTKDKRFDKQ